MCYDFTSSLRNSWYALRYISRSHSTNTYFRKNQFQTVCSSEIYLGSPAASPASPISGICDTAVYPSLSWERKHLQKKTKANLLSPGSNRRRCSVDDTVYQKNQKNKKKEDIYVWTERQGKTNTI